MPDGMPRLLHSTFSYPFGTLNSDSVLRIGPDRVAHVEYEPAPTPVMPLRMFGYRWALMNKYEKDVLVQHVVVLHRAGFKAHRDPVVRQFWPSVRVVNLQELNPGLLLSDVSLAPLASLGRGSPDERAANFGEAIRIIRARGGARVGELLQYAMVLARITLSTSIIERIVEEESMDETVAFAAGQVMLETRPGRALKRAIREEGREEGQAETRQQLLAVLLRDRFGDHAEISAIARELAGWPDTAKAVHAITTAMGLRELGEAIQRG